MWLLEMTALSACLLIIPHLYLGWRLKKYFSYVTETKLRVIPILLLASFYILPLVVLIKYLIAGQTTLVNFPDILIYWYWFGFVFTFQWLTWVILFDIARLATKNFLRRPVSQINSFCGAAAIVISAFLLVFTAIKMWVDTNQTDIKYTTVTNKQIPDSFNGFRIVHISDLQADKYTDGADIAAYVDIVNNFDPDLVIFTGDLVSWGTDYIDVAARELSKVKATYGLYTVIGDHDYWAGVKHIKAAYKKYNVNLLQNENTVIPVNGDSLLVTGITEVYDKKVTVDSLRKLTNAFKNVVFKIMATHQPSEKVIKSAKNNTYEMVLAGHTHGGQVRVPFMFTHISAPSLETDYLSGVYYIGDLLLNVNNGLGFTLAPVRYDAQPSVSVIDIKR